MSLRRVFHAIDINKTGYITLEELRTALERKFYFQVENTELESLFKALDTNGSGVIEYSDFLAATLHHNMLLDEKKLRLAFDRIDVSNTGYITKTDLAHVLGATIADSIFEDKEKRETEAAAAGGAAGETDAENEKIDKAKSFSTLDDAFVSTVIEQVDFKDDGRISFEEFLRAMKDETANDVDKIIKEGAKLGAAKDKERQKEEEEEEEEERAEAAAAAGEAEADADAGGAAAGAAPAAGESEGADAAPGAAEVSEVDVKVSVAKE